MKVEEAISKVCPVLSTSIISDGEQVNINRNCIAGECIFWEMTTNGKKEVDRYKIPYDTYPGEAARIHKDLKNKGYEEVVLKGEFRPTYIKYEEVYEGHCRISS